MGKNMKWFTSDLHLNHKNICLGISEWDDRSSCRNFDNLHDMNGAIIKSINDAVNPGDILYILGDFAFGDKSFIPFWRGAIDCADVRFLYGNHDQAIKKDHQGMFNNMDGQKGNLGHYGETTIKDYVGRKRGLIMFHYYIGGVWNKVGKGYGHIFGHSHGSFPKEAIHGKAFDIGWDVWRRPLNEEEVCDELNKLYDKEWADHHTDKTSYA